MNPQDHSLTPALTDLSKEDLLTLHRILRAEIRAYVDRRIMEEEATIAPSVIEEFKAFVDAHPQVSVCTLSDVIHRLTLGSIYNCFQFIRKAVKDPTNIALASQLSIEIGLALELPSEQPEVSEEIDDDSY